jgi:uncharacterized protein (TIGR03067 family)
MTTFLKILVICASLVFFLPPSTKTTDDKTSLQGLWQAQSVVVGGKDVSQEAAKFIQFIFREDKVIIKGNFGKDSTEECVYKIDSTKSPKHLDILPPSPSEPILAIYELNNDELKICVRRSPSPEESGERPKTFETKSDANLTLIISKQQK